MVGNSKFASFAYSFDAHNWPVTRNDDRFAYNDRHEIISSSIGTNRRLSTLYSAALKQFYYSPSGTAFAQKTDFIRALKVIYKNGTRAGVKGC